MKTMDGNQAAAARFLCIYRSSSYLPDYAFIRYAGAYR